MGVQGKARQGKGGNSGIMTSLSFPFFFFFLLLIFGVGVVDFFFSHVKHMAVVNRGKREGSREETTSCLGTLSR